MHRDSLRRRGRGGHRIQDGLPVVQADAPGRAPGLQLLGPPGGGKERPSLDALHRVLQDPVAQARCLGRQRRPGQPIQLPDQLRQLLDKAGLGVGHDEHIPRPGQGDIQDPQLLRDHLPPQL